MSFLKMSIFAFALFFYPMAVLGEDICEINPYQACPTTLNPLLGPLVTDEYIKDNCPKLLDYINCLGNYDQTCGDKVPRKVFAEEGEFDSIRDMFVDICDESSLLHTVLTRSFECLRGGLVDDDNNTCYADRNELSLDPALRAPQSGEGSEYDDGSYTPSEACFLQLYDSTCYIEYVAKNCGALAKDAVIEVLHRSFVLRKFCNPEAAVEFAEDIEKIKVRDSLKDILRELVEQILKKKV